jgi:hypothetical protein
LYVAAVLPNAVRFNADYYWEGIYSENLRACPVHSNCRLVVPADNARPHTSKQKGELMETNNLRSTSHPAFSPDLARSDFVSVGYIKGKLPVIEFRERTTFLPTSARFSLGYQAMY